MLIARDHPGSTAIANAVANGQREPDPDMGTKWCSRGATLKKRLRNAQKRQAQPVVTPGAKVDRELRYEKLRSRSPASLRAAVVSRILVPRPHG